MKFLEKKKKIINSNDFSVFVNSNIKNGLKNKSITNTLTLMKEIKTKYEKSPINIIEKGFKNLSLLVYIYKRKLGSKLVIIPVYWNNVKKLKKGFSIFYKQVGTRTETSLSKRIVNEFQDVILNKGKSIKARNDIYMLAAENQYNLRFVTNYSLEKKRKLDLERTEKFTNKVDIVKLDNYLAYFDSIKERSSFNDYYQPIIVDEKRR